jgi:hypothetical protein
LHILKAVVATPGDANLDGGINFDDYVRIDLGFNTGSIGWSNGDFNGDGSVNLDDYVLIDIAFNTQNGTLARALDWISGDDRSRAGLSDTAVATMLGHLDRFGSAYGAAFLLMVPEPAATFATYFLICGTMLRPKRRRRGHIA